MDPEQAYKDMIRAWGALTQAANGNPVIEREAAGLLDAIEALDGWLRKGGALPYAWGKGAGR